MQVSERLSNFISRRCVERMVIQENMLLHSLISYIHIGVIVSHRNEEAMLLKRFFDGFKMTFPRVK
jgi:hypothetical protein